MMNDGVFVNGITCLGDQVRLKREQAADEFTSNIVRAIDNGMSPPNEKWSKFFLEDGVLCRHAKSICIRVYTCTHIRVYVYRGAQITYPTLSL